MGVVQDGNNSQDVEEIQDAEGESEGKVEEVEQLREILEKLVHPQGDINPDLSEPAKPYMRGCGGRTGAIGCKP